MGSRLSKEEEKFPYSIKKEQNDNLGGNVYQSIGVDKKLFEQSYTYIEEMPGIVSKRKKSRKDKS